MDISWLTLGQIAVIDSLGQGLSTSDTAERLCLSPKKVRSRLEGAVKITGLSRMELIFDFVDSHFCDNVLPEHKFQEATRLFNSSLPVTQPTLNAFLDLWLEYMGRPPDAALELPTQVDVAKSLGIPLKCLAARLNRIAMSFDLKGRVHWYQLVRIAYMARTYNEARNREET